MYSPPSHLFFLLQIYLWQPSKWTAFRKTGGKSTSALELSGVVSLHYTSSFLCVIFNSKISGCHNLTSGDILLTEELSRSLKSWGSTLSIINVMLILNSNCTSRPQSEQCLSEGWVTGSGPGHCRNHFSSSQCLSFILISGGNDQGPSAGP